MTECGTQAFPDKHRQEDAVLIFDFALALPPAAVINSPSAAIRMLAGEDPDAATVLRADQIQVDGLTVEVPVTGGLPGRAYLVTVTFTYAGQAMAMDGYFWVR